MKHHFLNINMPFDRKQISNWQIPIQNVCPGVMISYKNRYEGQPSKLDRTTCCAEDLGQYELYAFLVHIWGPLVSKIWGSLAVDQNKFLQMRTVKQGKTCPCFSVAEIRPIQMHQCTS